MEGNMRTKILLGLSVVLLSFNILKAQSEEKKDASQISYLHSKLPKVIWANSFRFMPAPKLNVEKWITKKPEMKNKVIILEFWKSWCVNCKKLKLYLNTIQERYKEQVVVIGLNGEKEDIQKKMIKNANYYFAMDKTTPTTFIDESANEEEEDCPECDTLGDPNKIKERKVNGCGATEQKYRVTGWPHVVIIEPEEGYVIWEGYPFLRGHELTTQKLEKMLKICFGEVRSSPNN
jgi:thiol-disulfide isomerase/thioredoxin